MADLDAKELQALRGLRDMLIADLGMTDVRSTGEILVRVRQLQENARQEREEHAETLRELEIVRASRAAMCR